MSKYLEIEEVDYKSLLEIIGLWGVIVKAENEFLYEESIRKIEEIKSHVTNERTGDGTHIAGEIESVLDFINKENG